MAPPAQRGLSNRRRRTCSRSFPRDRQADPALAWWPGTPGKAAAGRRSSHHPQWLPTSAPWGLPLAPSATPQCLVGQPLCLGRPPSAVQAGPVASPLGALSRFCERGPRAAGLPRSPQTGRSLGSDRGPPQSHSGGGSRPEGAAWPPPPRMVASCAGVGGSPRGSSSLRPSAVPAAANWTLSVVTTRGLWGPACTPALPLSAVCPRPSPLSRAHTGPACPAWGPGALGTRLAPSLGRAPS